MGFIPRMKPEIPLRVGLAATYIFSGIDLVKNPTAWHWAVNQALAKLPGFFSTLVNETIGTNTFLKAQGVGELVLAALLLTWFLPKKFLQPIAIFITVEMFLILALTGIDYYTFRDLGLLGAGLALTAIAYRK